MIRRTNLIFNYKHSDFSFAKDGLSNLFISFDKPFSSTIDLINCLAETVYCIPIDIHVYVFDN